MSPITRLRAGATNIPNDLIAQYYRQRASAGLIITEGVPISKQAEIPDAGAGQSAHRHWQPAADQIEPVTIAQAG